MKKLLTNGPELLLAAVITSLFFFLLAGCMTGSRPQLDNVARFDETKGGTEIKGPTLTIWQRFQLSVITWRTGVTSTADEAGSVDVSSIASETALEKFAASVESKRGGDQSKTVTYGIGSLSTKAQAEVVRAAFEGISQGIAAYFTGAAPAAVKVAAKAIATDSALGTAEKKNALLGILPADAPSSVRGQLLK